MTYTQTPDRELLGNTLLSLHEAGYSYAELGKQYHRTADAVKGLVRTAKLKQPKEFNVGIMPTPLELAGDFIIVGDVHVPCTDWAFASLVGRVAEKTGIHRLIIAGDFFNFDMWSIYQHAVPPTTWREERNAARVLVGDWLETFSEIYTLQGNHDRRLQKWTAGEFDENDVWGLIATSQKLVHSNYGWCTVRSNGQPWRVTHPKNYGRNQLTVASDLAMKYQSNVITWHEHHSAHGWDTYGRFVTVNGGTLADANKFAYVSLDDNRMAAMMKSFVVLKNGTARVLGEYPFTDWSEWVN